MPPKRSKVERYQILVGKHTLILNNTFLLIDYPRSKLQLDRLESLKPIHLSQKRLPVDVIWKLAFRFVFQHVSFLSVPVN